MKITKIESFTRDHNGLVRVTTEESRTAVVNAVALPFLVNGHTLEWEESDR